MKALFKSIQEEFVIQKNMLLHRNDDPEVMQALQFKDLGNQCLSEGFFDEAIMYYTKSIAFSPTCALVFANRATAFKHKVEYELMLEDSKEAIKLDEQYFKGHLRHGEASVLLGKVQSPPTQAAIAQIREGIESLRVAQSLAWTSTRGNPTGAQKAALEQEIAHQILRAKKIKWMKEQEVRRYEVEAMLAELAERLTRSQEAPGCPATNEVAQRRSLALPSSSNTALESATPAGDELSVELIPGNEVQDGDHDAVCDGDQNENQNKDSHEQDKEDDIQQSLELYAKLEKELKAKEINTRELDVPDYLLCRITDELMDEPVTLSSGFTYEKSQILRHFQMNGNFDPMTREEVDTSILIPNKSLKYAIQDYLLNNPWAFERVYGETLEEIKM